MSYIKISGKLTTHVGNTDNGLDSSGMKVWATLPDKDPQIAEVLAQG